MTQQRIEVSRTGRRRTPDIASVDLTVPAHKDYVVIVRSTVAQLGSCFGFTVGEISDLRLAVNEACNVLVAAAPSRAATSRLRGLHCHAGVRGDLLCVEVTAPAATAEPPDTDDFGWAIMTSLVDALAWEQDCDTARVELEKHHSALL